MATKTALDVLKSEGAIADYLPFSHHVSDTAISTRNGEYMTILRISGRSHQAASEEEVFRWTRELNNAVRGLASAHVSLSTAEQKSAIRRRKTRPSCYMPWGVA